MLAMNFVDDSSRAHQHASAVQCIHGLFGSILLSIFSVSIAFVVVTTKNGSLVTDANTACTIPIWVEFVPIGRCRELVGAA